jgi:hypothetical protein
LSDGEIEAAIGVETIAAVEIAQALPAPAVEALKQDVLGLVEERMAQAQMAERLQNARAHLRDMIMELRAR